MTVRLKIADTYKREIEIELPGDGLKPEKAKITAVFRDLDPDQLETDQQKINGALETLLKLVKQMRSGKPDPDELAEAEEQVTAAQDITPKIDQILVGVEGLEVEGRDGELLTGKEMVDFVKKYPRIKNPILKKYAEENEEGESAALGNLLKSAASGRA